MSDEEFAGFIEYLRRNPEARAQLRDVAMMYEAVGSAGLTCIDPPESTKEHLETIEQVRATIHDACILKRKPTARSAGGK